MDPEASGNTCLQIEHAGQGYHNYQRYLSNWKQAAKFGNGTTDMSKRPPGFGLLYENTTVTAQWINVIDTVAKSKELGRAINNVSLAMPHAGVFTAAHDQRNDILQPEELNSEGTYTIKASVPSPVMHVLCVSMNKTELEPIIYQTWTNEKITNVNWDNIRVNATTNKTTVVDDIFGWTKKDNQSMIDYPPVFATYPPAFNTIMNHTSFAWGRDSIYLLGNGGPIGGGPDLNGTYNLCRIHVTLTANCSTQYNATGSGGNMEALCEDKADDMAYIKNYPNATEGVGIPDWRDVGYDWANSMSLNTGIMEGNASNSRLLTQLMITKNKKEELDLNPALPSMAEALAVMSGCTYPMFALLIIH